MTEKTAAFIAAACEVMVAVSRFSAAWNNGLSDSTKRKRARDLKLSVETLDVVVKNTPKSQRSSFRETLEELVERILAIPYLESIVRFGSDYNGLPTNAIAAARTLDAVLDFVARKTPSDPYRTDKETGKRLRDKVRYEAYVETTRENGGYNVRRVDVTHNGETERRYVIVEPNETIYSLFTPSEWEGEDWPSWTLEEGGEGLLFQGGVPYGTSSFNWIDAEPCRAAYNELKAAVKKLEKEER